MPTHYTITYNGVSRHEACATNTDTVTMQLVADGRVQHASKDVDLLTIYHTPNGAGAYPTSFTLLITYGSWWQVESIHKFETGGTTASITAADDEDGEWTLTVSGPTAAVTTNFQLDHDGSTPPEKLRIRVKRQESFDCTNGLFDATL